MAGILRAARALRELDPRSIVSNWHKFKKIMAKGESWEASAKITTDLADNPKKVAEIKELLKNPLTNITNKERGILTDAFEDIPKFKRARAEAAKSETDPRGHKKGGTVVKNKSSRPQMMHGGVHKGKLHSYTAGGAVKNMQIIRNK